MKVSFNYQLIFHHTEPYVVNCRRIGAIALRAPSLGEVLGVQLAIPRSMLFEEHVRAWRVILLKTQYLIFIWWWKGEDVDIYVYIYTNEYNVMYS